MNRGRAVFVVRLWQEADEQSSTAARRPTLRGSVERVGGPREGERYFSDLEALPALLASLSGLPEPDRTLESGNEGPGDDRGGEDGRD